MTSRLLSADHSVSDLSPLLLHEFILELVNRVGSFQAVGLENDEALPVTDVHIFQVVCAMKALLLT